MKEEIKRVFFGIEVHAPWPAKLPEGRILREEQRHLTLAFLGNVPYSSIHSLLDGVPTPKASISSVGYFDACLFLPPRRPSVVAWEVKWLGTCAAQQFQQELVKWLENNKIEIDKRKWLPHVTLCRRPFDLASWKKAFFPLPLYTSHLHLYESLGNSVYQPLWSFQTPVPFEEIDHIADIAFIIRGETMEELYYRSFTALAFKYPPLIGFFEQECLPSGLDDLIILLNQIISKADQAVGCPMKAVSFHGDLIRHDQLLEWEMIVDV